MRLQRPIASALAALVLAASGAASARPDDRGPPGHDRHGGPRADHRHGPGGPGPYHDHHDHHDRHGGPGRGVARGNPHIHPDPGPGAHFRRGGRLPPAYRHHHYVVDDWRGHRLAPPPRGYHWVQAGGDYLLVAIATGIIAQVLLGR